MGNGIGEVIMDLNEYLRLRKASEMFYALQAAGVEKWDKYEKAVEIYEESNEL